MMALSDYIRNIKERLNPQEGGSRYISTDTRGLRIDEASYVVFDTELSGLDPAKDFIVSIGALKITGGKIDLGNEFYRLVKPVGEMTKKSIEIHGITPGELETARGLDEVLPEFLDYITDSVLVGHFVSIDMAFVNAALKSKYNEKLRNTAVDTGSVHEWLSDNGAAFRKHYRGGSVETDLFSIAQRCGITIDSTHNALNDAFITAQLFQRFLYFLKADGILTLNELFDIGRA
jgi:DNA polymerase-3 subunit epsilon